MPSSTTECGKSGQVSGIARGELRSTWAELAFDAVGVVSGHENFISDRSHSWHSFSPKISYCALRGCL